MPASATLTALASVAIAKMPMRGPASARLTRPHARRAIRSRPGLFGAGAGAPGRVPSAARRATRPSPSMSTSGIARDSQRGSHQLQRPIRVRTAGASRSTIEAARATATARPTPNCLTVGSPFSTKLPNTPIMMSAAAVITGAVFVMAPAIDPWSPWPACRRIATAESRNTW